MAIDRLQSITTKELVPQKSLEGEKTLLKNKTGVPSQPSGDEVQISAEARELKENFENLKIQAQVPTDDSQARIESAKQRIASGFYNQDEILEQTADKILKSDHFRAVIQGSIETGSLVTISPDASEVRTEKVHLARSRMAEGYYQRSDIVTVTAEKIIKDLFA